VHLAIHTEQRAVGVDHGRSVVVEPSRALLEQRDDDDGAVLLREARERVGRRAGNGLGEREESMILDLAEILRSEQLLRADDLRTIGHGALGQA
jgi:hypothetical protein